MPLLPPAKMETAGVDPATLGSKVLSRNRPVPIDNMDAQLVVCSYQLGVMLWWSCSHH